MEPGIEVEDPAVGGVAVCVAPVVEVGPKAGGDVGLALVLSPPHAARSNTRVRMMPVKDSLGKDHFWGRCFKVESPSFDG